MNPIPTRLQRALVCVSLAFLLPAGVSALTVEFPVHAFSPRLQPMLVETQGRDPGGDFARINHELDTRPPEEVVRKAEAVLVRHPDSSLAWEVLGTAQLKAGDASAAVAAFKKAVELDPKQPGPLTKWASQLMQSGDVDGAETLLLRAVQAPGARRAHQRLGLIYEYRADYPRAVEHFRKGLEGTPPTYLGVAVNLGRVLNETERYAETVAMLGPRLADTSDDADAHLILATALLRTGDSAAARERFARASALQPERAEMQLGVALAARAMGDHEAALVALDAVVAMRGDWTVGLLERAYTLVQLERVAEAVTAFEAARAAGASADLVDTGIAGAYLQAKDFAAAEPLYQGVVSRGSADPAVYVFLSELQQGRGDDVAGEQTLRDAVARYPGNAYLRMRLGSYLAVLRRYDEAVAVLQQAVELAPENPTILRTLSLALYKAGNTGRAAEVAGRLRALSPGRTAGALLHASMLEADGQAPAAVDIYREVLVRSPDNIVALNNLASLLSAMGEHEQAVEKARRAQELAPRNVAVADTYGKALLEAGAVDDALDVLGRAQALSAGYAAVRLHLGEAHIAAASRSLRELLDLAPDGEGVSRASEMLDRGAIGEAWQVLDQAAVGTDEQRRLGEAQIAAAVLSLQEVIELAPGSEYATTARTLLAGLNVAEAR